MQCNVILVLKVHDCAIVG